MKSASNSSRLRRLYSLLEKDEAATCFQGEGTDRRVICVSALHRKEKAGSLLLSFDICFEFTRGG